MKIGLICFENPFSFPLDGGKKCMLSRILSLCLIKDVELDLYLFDNNVSFVSELEKETILKNSQIKNVFKYPKKSIALSIFGKFPICNNRRFHKECVEEIKKHRYDFLIYEGEQIARYRFFDYPNVKKHIIYMHDIESEYRRQLSLSQKNIVGKLLNRLESSRFKRIENELDKLFDDLWFISNDEYLTFKKRLSDNKGCYLPYPSLSFSSNDRHANKKKNSLLYVGDLRLDNNLSSINWFVNNVFNLVKKDNNDATLQLIGKIDKKNKQNLLKDGVIVEGYVEDIENCYKESSCFVAPVLYGAGVKIKIIDALSKNIIVVTTSKGVEGTQLVNGKHLFVEDDPQKMADIINNILKNGEEFNKISEQGYEFIRNNHSVKNQFMIIEKRLQLLENKKD